MMRILTPETCVDVSGRLISRLRKAGYHTFEAIDNATAIEISTYAGITYQQAQNIKNKLKTVISG
jgi:hypothetical protein